MTKRPKVRQGTQEIKYIVTRHDTSRRLYSCIGPSCSWWIGAGQSRAPFWDGLSGVPQHQIGSATAKFPQSLQASAEDAWMRKEAGYRSGPSASLIRVGTFATPRFFWTLPPFYVPNKLCQPWC